MAKNVPNVTFKNGVRMPIIGIGTWKSGPGEVTSAVKEAIACGYRHIDCANAYLNEAEVGAGIQAKLQDGTVKREELFITTKLWLTNYRKDLVVPSLKKQLKSLGLAYLDLFLLHWPVVLKEGKDIFPSDAEGNAIFGSAHFLETWRGMEECVRDGLTKSIGISNFNTDQIERLVKAAEIHPSVNQIECHPYLTQKQLIEFCSANDIAVTAYSPLGSPDRPVVGDNDPVLLDEPIIKKLAEKYNKNPGQILIRYHIENGRSVIPKSVSPSRIRSNFEVFDFHLTPEEIKSLDALNRDFRYIAFTFIEKHPEYPFNAKY